MQRNSNLGVPAKQRSQSSIDVKNPNVAELEAVAYIRPVNSNLTTHDKTGIGDILGNGSDFQLGLNLALQSNINIVNNMVANEMATLGEFIAKQSQGGGLRGDQINGSGGRHGKFRRRGGRKGHGRIGGRGKKSHQPGARIRARRRKVGLLL